MTAELFDLCGRVALVTGGSKGIGKEIARGLVLHGADVVICGREQANLQATRDELAGLSGARVFAVACDLSHRSEAERLAQQAETLCDRVDILVSNAGTK